MRLQQNRPHRVMSPMLSDGTNGTFRAGNEADFPWRNPSVAPALGGGRMGVESVAESAWNG